MTYWHGRFVFFNNFYGANIFFSIGRRRRFGTDFFFRVGVFVQGQENGKGGAHVDLALRGQAAMVHIDQIAGQGQADAGALLPRWIYMSL